MPAHSERVDVERAAVGDHDAFERLYRNHIGRIYSLAVRMTTAEEAEDLVQEVFIRAWSKLGTFRGDAQFGTWLHRLAVNHILRRRATSGDGRRDGSRGRASCRAWWRLSNETPVRRWISTRHSIGEAWADLVIEVPAGRTVSAYLAVGQMDASGVDGNLRLDTGSGGITASDISGALDIDSGSGSVEVRGVEGTLRLDTGSGGVEVTDVTGDRVQIDTGSGSVDVTDVVTERIGVDTGSGSVVLNGVSSSDVVVDTGSGRIEVELLTDVDRLVLDTGSGSVTVRVPGDIGAMVEIDTGSGGIDLDFPLEVSSVRRDRVQGRIGHGEGSIRIDTGSGSVRVLTTN